MSPHSDERKCSHVRSIRCRDEYGVYRRCDKCGHEWDTISKDALGFNVMAEWTKGPGR